MLLMTTLTKDDPRKSAGNAPGVDFADTKEGKDHITVSNYRDLVDLKASRSRSQVAVSSEYVRHHTVTDRKLKVVKSILKRGLFMKLIILDGQKRFIG